MNCNLKNREELISKYLLNELSEDECLKFEEHYFVCEECFNELKAAEEALALIKIEGKSFKKSSFKQSIIDKIFGSSSTSLKWAFGFASLIILLIIGYAIFRIAPEKNTEEFTLNTEKDSLQNITEEEIVDSLNLVKEKQNLIAELSGPSFKSNSYYEEWMNENIRSLNNIVEKVLSPEIGDTITDKNIVFNFVLKDKMPVRLIVLDNSENQIESVQLNQSENPEYDFKLNTSSLKSGLYYWKIEDESEVLHIGKFYFVRRK